jgi:RNA-directed DNA polymerase
VSYKPIIPTTERELRNVLDKLYSETQTQVENNNLLGFVGLLEVIKSDATIVTAIHNIKSNSGSNTRGTDDKTINDILVQRYDEVLTYVKENLDNHKPQKIRRVRIPKADSTEKRPLGIPTIGDRIIQECVRIVIEPIMEAQFFNHSYGFRPMRETSMALERINTIIHRTGYHWIVEGDISKYFDTINHTVLIRKLYNMGIKDKRVLMIIKAMLKAGVLNESEVNEYGTPQGGIISPLLANVYLHSLDMWIAKQWEHKKTNHKFSRQDGKIRYLKKTTLKPAYLVRYADDWVLITDSKENAEKWKYKIQKYLRNNLCLELSEKKTLITKITKKPINFLGYQLKFIKGSARKGYICKSRPNLKRLEAKAKDLKRAIWLIRKSKTQEDAVNYINRVNSQIRGVVQYYQYATNVHKDMEKYADRLDFTALKTVKKLGGRRIKANATKNLNSVHSEYTTKIPSIQHKDMWIGITRLSFIRWKKANNKMPEETPYSTKGRELNVKRTFKKPLRVRADELFNDHFSYIISKGETDSKYNFEYYMNRPYAYNRDKGKCRVCGTNVHKHNVNIHHNSPNLPLNEVNKVSNLATVCIPCHKRIHNNFEYDLSGKEQKKLKKLRELLVKQ